MARKANKSLALNRLAAKFKALGGPTRLKLLLALQKGERTVSQLINASGTSQGNVSRQLQTLCDAGLLRRRKAGLHVYYGVTDPQVFQLCQSAGSVPAAPPHNRPSRSNTR